MKYDTVGPNVPGRCLTERIERTVLNGWPGTCHLQRRIYPSNTRVEGIIRPGGEPKSVAWYSVTKDSNKSRGLEGTRRLERRVTARPFARCGCPGHIDPACSSRRRSWARLNCRVVDERTSRDRWLRRKVIVDWSDWLLARPVVIWLYMRPH